MLTEIEMDFFAILVTDDVVAADAARLPTLTGPARVRQLVQLAWHSRQRDCARAQQYAREAEACMDRGMAPAGPAPAWQAPLRTRLQLVRAESLWLYGQLAPARTLASQVLAASGQSADAAARADTHWLQAWLALDRGDVAGSERALALAAAQAGIAGDPVRCDLFDAAAALLDVTRNLPQAYLRWQQRFGPETAWQQSGAAGWVHDFLGMSALQASDFGRAVPHLISAFERAIDTGQLRRAIVLAANLGNAFSQLNAYDTGLDWLQRGTLLAAQAGWPGSIAACRLQSGETLRLLGQFDLARQALDEAAQLLAPWPGTRWHAIGLEYRGDLAFDLGQHGAALAYFTELEQRAVALLADDLRGAALCGQARAQSALGRAQAALASATAALALARERGCAAQQVAVLHVLATLHASHQLAPALLPVAPGVAGAPDADRAPQVALRYLQQALALADGIDGYAVPCALLEAAATAHAAAGDFAGAYQLGARAAAVRAAGAQRQAQHRAAALQVQHDGERARQEGERQRRRAQAEARRITALQQTSATLAHLSAIGQEITAHLDAAAVFHTLECHLHGLLDAVYFAVHVLEPDGHGGQHLQTPCCVEGGRALAPFVLAFDAPDSSAIVCVAERREVLVERGAGAPDPGLLPGTLPTRSRLFAPLLVGDRVLGCLTVQSLHAGAYGERERLVLRTLAAYAAIALDNASAYRQVASTLQALNQTQAELLVRNAELQQAYAALEQVSLTDQLTGLRNRRFLLQQIDADVALTLRAHDDGPADSGVGRDLVFFMIDLDHFKRVNDQHGHAAGDMVLVDMQQRLQLVFRESDHLVRWGGEEFLVVARASQRADAWAVAERIRAVVAGRPFQLPGGVAMDCTCSVGYACYPFVPAAPRLLGWEQVVELADQALYLAKAAGRNRWATLVAGAGAGAACVDKLFPRAQRRLDDALRDGDVQLLTSDTACAALAVNA